MQQQQLPYFDQYLNNDSSMGQMHPNSQIHPNGTAYEDYIMRLIRQMSLTGPTYPSGPDGGPSPLEFRPILTTSVPRQYQTTPVAYMQNQYGVPDGPDTYNITHRIHGVQQPYPYANHEISPSDGPIHDTGWELNGGRRASAYKEVGKKEILGKIRVIYKMKGSNKEYVKSKGVFIPAVEYKKINANKKAK